MYAVRKANLSRTQYARLNTAVRGAQRGRRFHHERFKDRIVYNKLICIVKNECPFIKRTRIFKINQQTCASARS